jgi:hypothetical protein
VPPAALLTGRNCYDYEGPYPLALLGLWIELGDGVLVNCLRFGKAVVTVPAIEQRCQDVENWTWPKYPLRREDA